MYQHQWLGSVASSPPALLSASPHLCAGALASQTRTNPSSDDVSTLWQGPSPRCSLKWTPVTGPSWPANFRSSSQLPALWQS